MCERCSHMWRHLRGLAQPHQPWDEPLDLFPIWWLQLMRVNAWLQSSAQVRWGLWLCCFSLRVRFCCQFPKISGEFFATFKGMGVTLQRKLPSHSSFPHCPCHKTRYVSSMYCPYCWQSSDSSFCKSSFKTDVRYHISHSIVWVHHLAISLKCSFWFSRWDMRLHF